MIYCIYNTSLTNTYSLISDINKTSPGDSSPEILVLSLSPIQEFLQKHPSSFRMKDNALSDRTLQTEGWLKDDGSPRRGGMREGGDVYAQQRLKASRTKAPTYGKRPFPAHPHERTCGEHSLKKGSYLLSRLADSTIGDGGLNCSVRA